MSSITSSSVVAKRPRDVSYLSVVSFNSTKRRAQSFIVSYVEATDLSLRTIKCCSVVFGVTLRLLVIHFVVVSRHQQTRPLTTSDK